MKMTKIICTLGPAVDTEEKLIGLMDNGMDVARFNFSHGDHDSQQERVNRIKAVREKFGKNVALLLDTKGPEIRIGKFEDDTVELVEGEFFVLYNEERLGNQDGVTITHKELYEDVYPGKRILINDGMVELVVVNVDGKDIVCKVINGGVISNNKGVNIPDTDTHLPSLTEQDIKDIEFGIKNDFDFIAASFVRKGSDVVAVKEILKKYNAEHIKVISKIENREGVDNFLEILKESDGIMVARGDLGVEIPFEDIPALQKYICEECNKVNKISIVATQMLESMIKNPRPTRAEVSDVANAIYDNTSAIMLSGESAAGSYPIESVATMSKVASRTEETLAQLDMSINWSSGKYNNSKSIAMASVVAADSVGAKAIICLTESGYTAKNMSLLRCSVPVIAITHDIKVCRNLMLTYGVYPVLMKEEINNAEKMFDIGVATALLNDICQKGDKIVITSGENSAKSGTTNVLKIHTV